MFASSTEISLPFDDVDLIWLASVSVRNCLVDYQFDIAVRAMEETHSESRAEVEPDQESVLHHGVKGGGHRGGDLCFSLKFARSSN